MRQRQAIHTSVRDERWVNTREGSSREIAGTFASQAEALTVGRRLARRERAEHVCHRADDKIDEITLPGD